MSHQLPHEHRWEEKSTPARSVWEVCVSWTLTVILRSGLVTYCVMSVPLRWSRPAGGPEWHYRLLTLLPGASSTSFPLMRGSSGPSSKSQSRPRQDDCMRPVRRLPVFPWGKGGICFKGLFLMCLFCKKTNKDMIFNDHLPPYLCVY